MDGLVIVLVVAVAAAIGALVTALVLRARKQGVTPRPSTDPLDDHRSVFGDPRLIKIGDLVDIRGESYLVRGTVRLDEGGWSWVEHLLEQADGERVWLSVEEDPAVEMIVWSEVDGDLTPGAKTVTFNGKRYHADEAGDATFRAEGTTGLKPEGTVSYADYESADDWLSFESYGGSKWELSTGITLSDYDVRIYPASEA